MANPLRVLLIEDSPDDGFLIQHELTRGGFEVTMNRVYTPGAMQKALAEAEWDLIISDYNLPGFNGMAALQLFKSNNLDIPFILVSGAIGEETAVDAMKAGAQDYVKKDNLARLIPAVNRELREAEGRRERRRVSTKLLESEARYRTLVQNIPIGVYRTSTDPQGAFLMANDAFMVMLGIADEKDISNFCMADFYYSAQDYQSFRDLIFERSLLTGYELLLRKRDGSPMWGSITAQVGQEQERITFDCTIEDITERKHSDKLKESLYRISQAAITARNMEELLALFHQVIGELMPANNFFLALYDESTGLLEYPYWVDEKDPKPEQEPPGSGLTAYVLRTGEPLLASPLVFDHLVENGKVESLGSPCVDWLGVPLKNAENKTIGVMVVQTYDPGFRFTEQDREVLMFFSTQAALAIERKRAEDALRSSESQQRALIEALPDILLLVDAEGIFIDFRSTGSDLAFSPESFLGRPVRECFLPEIAEQGHQAVRQALVEQTIQHMEFEYTLPRESQPRLFEARFSASGPDQVMVLVRDVTEEKRAEQRLEEQRAFLRQVIDINPNFIFAKDKQGRYFLANESVAAVYGVTVEELIGKTDAEINQNINEVEAYRRDDMEVVETGREKIVPVEPITDYNGNMRWMQTVKRPLIVPGMEGVQVLGVSTDISERKRAEELLVHNALHDSLTGLPNWALFADRLGRAIERGRRHASAVFAVLMLDLDRFAMINDSLGHVVGDHLLIAASGRLEACLRTADTIARTGGDEFVILLEDLDSIGAATQVADRILAEISLPFILQENQVVISASIGIVIGSANYERPEDVLRDAEIAMYRAKAAGRARYVLFSNVMRADVVASLQLENDLRHAIEHHELELHFEPIISLKDGEMISMEALVRWRHPQRGLIYPGEFIPFAEKTGLIIPMGEWILAEACRQLKAWQDLYPKTRQIKVSVNLSSKQFSQPDLVGQIAQVLKETGLDASCLRLEITETIIMENAEGTIATLRQLREMGVQIHVDDFGTGYSSLVYLHLLPLNAIKIDRSFISGQSNRTGRLEIARTIVRLATDLRLETVAEGVETEQHLLQLQAIGCNYAQGFLFAHTMEPRMMEQYLQGQSVMPSWKAALLQHVQ